MTRRGVDPATVSLVRGLDIDQQYLRHVISELTAIGSTPLGFRNTGTAEDKAVAAFISAEMRAIGLSDVATEPVEVDGWRFLGAAVTLHGAQPLALDAVSFGGVPGTPAEGVTAPLVDVADGRRSRLDGLRLSGAIALVDWRRAAIHPSALVLELAERGVRALVVNCPSGGPWYQTPDAVGAFDGHWPLGAPPMVLISKEHAAMLRAATRGTSPRVTVSLEVDFAPDTLGYNVVGFLSGDRPGPIVVGAHHDAWFQGAFDNTSGVAAMLAMAKALVGAKIRPLHTVCFTSRTAEEYGIAGSTYDWCIGAWRQVEQTHPEWSKDSPFHLCVEASGHRELRSVIEAPVELVGWARRVGRVAEQQGWTPTGWRVAPPVAGTEQWPFLVAGIPGLACYAWEKSFGKTDYHTQFDTIDLLDFDFLSAQVRLYALLLLDADREPDAVFDHRARARELARIAAEHGHAGLASAAQRHASATGRADFTAVGQGLFALNAHAELAYPHEQSARDLRAIRTALDALDNSKSFTALRALRTVGHHYLHSYLGASALGAHSQRYLPEAVSRTWASRSHLTDSPMLWEELASLGAEPGSRPLGAGLRTHLAQAEQETAELLTVRLDAMARSLTTRRSVT